MDGAADQRQPLVCLALPLKESQESRLGVLSSPGRAHTHTHTHTDALTISIQTPFSPSSQTSFPAADLPDPPHMHLVRYGPGQSRHQVQLAGCSEHKEERRGYGHNLTNYKNANLTKIHTKIHTKTCELHYGQTFRARRSLTSGWRLTEVIFWEIWKFWVGLSVKPSGTPATKTLQKVSGLV